MRTRTTIPVFIEVEGEPAEAYALLYAALGALSGPLTPNIMGWGSFDPDDCAKWFVARDGEGRKALTRNEVGRACSYAFDNLIPED